MESPLSGLAQGFQSGWGIVEQRRQQEMALRQQAMSQLMAQLHLAETERHNSATESHGAAQVDESRAFHQTEKARWDAETARRQGNDQVRADTAARRPYESQIAQFGRDAAFAAPEVSQMRDIARSVPGLSKAPVQREVRLDGPPATPGGPFPTATQTDPSPRQGADQRFDQLAATAGQKIASQRLQLARARGPAAGVALDDVQALADGIQNGQLPPDMKGRSAPQVRAELARRGFDLSRASLEWQATQRHLSTLNSNQQERMRQATDFVSHQIPEIERLYQEWQQVAPTSGLRVFNRAALGAARQMGGKPGAVAQALETQINDLSSELGNVYMGGNTPTDHALALARQNLAAEWDEPTFTRSIQLLKQNLGYRVNAMRSSAPAGLPSPSRYLGAPPAGVPGASMPPPPGAGGAPKVTHRFVPGQGLVPVGGQ